MKNTISGRLTVAMVCQPKIKIFFKIYEDICCKSASLGLLPRTTSFRYKKTKFEFNYNVSHRSIEEANEVSSLYYTCHKNYHVLCSLSFFRET